jgi:hypothetical protein
MVAQALDVMRRWRSATTDRLIGEAASTAAQEYKPTEQLEHSEGRKRLNYDENDKRDEYIWCFELH